MKNNIDSKSIMKEWIEMRKDEDFLFKGIEG